MRGQNTEAGKHNGELTCMWSDPGVLAGQCRNQQVPEYQGLPSGARAAGGLCRNPSIRFQAPAWGQRWTKARTGSCRID